MEDFFKNDKMFFMTVGELKVLLEGADDSAQVLIPLNAGDGFDGAFFTPCIEESGMGEVGIVDGDEEDLQEMELLGKEISKPEFLLVPHGFFEIEEDEINPKLN